SAATNAPPSPHESSTKSSNAPPGATDPLHPSTGATSPLGVRHEYTWYIPACALAASRASARLVASTTLKIRLTISLVCRQRGPDAPPRIFDRRGGGGKRCLQGQSENAIGSAARP